MQKIIVSMICVWSVGWSVAMIKPAPLAKALQISINGMNESLPVMIDGELRHDKVEASDNAMTFRFTLVNFTQKEMNAKKLKSLMEADIRQGVCSDKDAQMMLQGGVKMIYDYSDKNKKHITKFIYDAETCGTESDIDKLQHILNVTKKQ